MLSTFHLGWCAAGLGCPYFITPFLTTTSFQDCLANTAVIIPGTVRLRSPSSGHRVYQQPDQLNWETSIGTNHLQWHQALSLGIISLSQTLPSSVHIHVFPFLSHLYSYHSAHPSLNLVSLPPTRILENREAHRSPWSSMSSTSGFSGLASVSQHLKQNSKGSYGEPELASA